MANHPNLNWRQRLNTAADQWLSTQEAEFLQMPVSPGGFARRLRLAYLAGLRDGEGRDIDLVSLDRHDKL